MLRIPFEWLEFAFELLESVFNVKIYIQCFKSHSNGLNLLRIPCDWFNLVGWLEFSFEYFKSLSKG